MLQRFSCIFLGHCVKSIQIWSFFWSVFSCIQSEHRKIRTRKNSDFKKLRIDLQSKSVNWFLYDRDLRHGRVKWKQKDLQRNIEKAFRVIKTLLPSLRRFLFTLKWFFSDKSPVMRKKFIEKIDGESLLKILLTLVWTMVWSSF